MTKSTAIKTNEAPALSLIERAVNVYGFGGGSPREADPIKPVAPIILPEPELPAPELPALSPAPVVAASLQALDSFLAPASAHLDNKANEKRPSVMADQPARAPKQTPAVATVNRDLLSERGFIVPDSVPGPLAEEFRIIKRQLLVNASGALSGRPIENGRMILVCSAQSNDGKTFCAVNLALSLATERDTEVLLVDGDVAKPEILSTLGIEGRQGLMDALSDPSLDIEDLIIPTDIAKLSVLGAGRQTNDDTELLASSRTREILAAMAAHNPSRIVIFDSAPALAASPASALALHVGQVVMVVRADRTTESELRDAVAMVSDCANINLLLNGATYVGGNHSFGSYYGRKK
jgi:protein-tyrosine kinase